jgi:hypothetical protein
MNENFPYKDIIDLPHHQAEGRKHMSLYDRAAQFSAFAALSGYDDIIAESGRLTSNKIELPEDIQDELDRKFALLISMTNEGYRPDVTVSYFVPDKTKEGGSYESYTGDIKRIETTSKQLMFYDKEKDLTGKIIDIGMIISIESNLFDKMM